MEQNVLERILNGSMQPTILPFETLRKITDEFSTERIVGEGGFGTIYKGVIGNKNVAVKRILSSKTINDKLFRREVNSLMEVNHENIVQFLGLCSHTVETPIKNPESRGYIYAEMRERLLCFEYISNGSLDRKITDELRGLEWDKRYKIIKGVCAGLNYLHNEKGIIHMDLKPANILLDDQMAPKITDFGLSRPTENSQTTSTDHFVSRGYTAPENIFGGSMTVMSDVYSLGVIIIEVVTGHKGIPDNSNNILRRWWHRWIRSAKSAKEVPLEYHQQVTKCIEIGRLCLKIDRLERPSISEIMSKFVEVDKDSIGSNISQPAACYWEDDMLGVEPLELQFANSWYNKEEEQILSWSVELCNGTDGSIAFKIQRTSPLPYSIEPNMGIVKPGSKCSVEITLPQGRKAAALRYSASNKHYTEEFVVRSIKVNEDLITEDIKEHMFTTDTSDHIIDEIHLTVVSEEPCNKESISCEYAAAEDDPLPGIEGLRITGEAFPGRELQASGYSTDGTTSCIFEWVRHLDDGSVKFIEGASQPNYLVTADDVGTLLAIEVQPLDDRKRKGDIVKFYPNDQAKITCDPETKELIKKTLEAGHVSYQVQLHQVRFLDMWEPAVLAIKREGYSIKCNGQRGVVLTEKFQQATAINIPSGYERATEFLIVSADGVEYNLRSAENTPPRDTIVLVLRLFRSMAVEKRRGRKWGLFFK